MTVAELIKKTRTDHNMTQEDYGQKFGVTRQTVSSWENGRSMPDLQMLIDICNAYQESLDKLLNENKGFVDKIDLRVKLFKSLKYIIFAVVFIMIIFGMVVVNWNSRATEMNEQFVINATQAGFVIENGVFVMKKDEVVYSLPNQKLPFLKKDFYAKYAHAQNESDSIVMNLTLVSYNTVIIEFNHDKTITAIIKSDGNLEIDRDKLTDDEKKLFDENAFMIKKMVEQTKEFYDKVYRTMN